MGLTSSGTLIVLVMLALAAPVAAALAWNRTSHRPWLRWPGRIGLLVACQVTACLAVAAAVNDAGQFYTSWDQLFGSDVGVSRQAARADGHDPALLRQLAVGYETQHSIVVTVPIPDAGDSRAHNALVYLPAAYFQPEYADRSFPVIELFDGFPGSPQTWTHVLDVQSVVDTEIVAGRAVPFVAVMPQQNYLGHRDGECINAVHGAQVESTLTANVRTVIEHDFRVGADARDWAAMGYSTGGFCALNVAVRHPDWYSAAVSMSGYDQPYVDHQTGRIFGTSALARDTNDPLWRLQHLAPPDVSLLLTTSGQDPSPVVDAAHLARAVHGATHLELLQLPRGGHTFGIWRAVEPAAFDWLSARLGAPLAPMVLTGGMLPHPYLTPRHTTRPRLVSASQQRR